MRASSSRYKPIKRLSAFLGQFAAGKCFVLEDGDVGDWVAIDHYQLRLIITIPRSDRGVDFIEVTVRDSW